MTIAAGPPKRLDEWLIDLVVRREREIPLHPFGPAVDVLLNRKTPSGIERRQHSQTIGQQAGVASCFPLSVVVKLECRRSVGGEGQTH